MFVFVCVYGVWVGVDVGGSGCVLVSAKFVFPMISFLLC